MLIWAGPSTTLLVSLKTRRQRSPWHLWQLVALHCGLNYWWRALLSQCVLPTFKWNSRIELSLPPHSLQLLHDIYDVVQIAPKQLISSGVCTQNEDLTITEAGFSMSTTTHSSILYTKKSIKIYGSGICDPFLLLKSSSGFQDFVSYLVLLCIFLKRWVDLPSQYIFYRCLPKFYKILLTPIHFFFLDEALVWLFLPVKYSLIFVFRPKVILWPWCVFSSSNEWNEWHVYAYVCVSAYVYVYLSLCMHTCMCCVCLYLYIHIYQRIQ